MEVNYVTHPIQVILDGPNNYYLWAQSMRSFLKGSKLWLYVTGDLEQPIKDPDESQDTFESRFEDWDSNNHKIITWFRNSSIPSIGMLLGSLDTAKAAWDKLAIHYSRYSRVDSFREYQLFVELHHLKQQPGESINDLFLRMQYLWDQLSLYDPTWDCACDAQKFREYQDRLRLFQFLMALHEDFESIRAQILHRSPLPSIDQAFKELRQEETRLQVLQSQPCNPILATSSLASP